MTLFTEETEPFKTKMSYVLLAEERNIISPKNKQRAQPKLIILTPPVLFRAYLNIYRLPRQMADITSMQIAINIISKHQAHNRGWIPYSNLTEYKRTLRLWLVLLPLNNTPKMSTKVRIIVQRGLRLYTVQQSSRRRIYKLCCNLA